MSQAIIQELRSGDDASLAKFQENMQDYITMVYEQAKRSLCVEYDVLRDYPSKMFEGNDILQEVLAYSKLDNEYRNTMTAIKNGSVKETRKVKDRQKKLTEEILPGLKPAHDEAKARLQNKRNGFSYTVRPYAILNKNRWIVERSDDLCHPSGYEKRQFRAICQLQAMLMVDHVIADPKAKETLTYNQGYRAVMVELKFTKNRVVDDGKALEIKEEWVDIIEFFHLCHRLMYEEDGDKFLDLLTSENFLFLYHIGADARLKDGANTSAALENLKILDIVGELLAEGSSQTTGGNGNKAMVQSLELKDDIFWC